MTERHSTAPSPLRKPAAKHRKRKPGKRHPGEPAKPYKGFPLFTVSSGNGKGRWAKKICGKLHYFGPWDDWRAALDKWEVERADLLAGRKPAARREKDGESTMRDLANRFLAAKESRVESGELSPHSYRDYYRVCQTLVETFGKEKFVSDLRPHDFERLRAAWAKRLGPKTLGNRVNCARIVFHFAIDEAMIEKPFEQLVGKGFCKPSKKVMRKHRQTKGKRLFHADELRSIIEKARQPMKAMILLGVNCGLGNSDVARMTLDTIDLDGGWLNYPRHKTGVERRCSLWPETIAALRDWLAVRPAPADPENAELLFLTAFRGSWYRDTSDNPVSRVMRELLDSLKITGNKNFYALRYTTETIGGGSLDQVALDAIMGHVDPSMGAEYREEVADGRLVAVAEHIRAWLFGATEKGKQESPRLKIAGEGGGAAAASA